MKGEINREEREAACCDDGKCVLWYWQVTGERWLLDSSDYHTANVAYNRLKRGKAAETQARYARTDAAAQLEQERLDAQQQLERDQRVRQQRRLRPKTERRKGRWVRHVSHTEAQHLPKVVARAQHRSFRRRRRQYVCRRRRRR